MPRFMLFYKGEATDPADMTEEERQSVMAAWGAWMEDVGSALVDVGAPLAQGASIVDDGTTGTPTPLSGYSIVEAAFDVLVEPLPQFRGRRDFGKPRAFGPILSLDASRPEPVDEESIPTRAGQVVHACEVDSVGHMTNLPRPRVRSPATKSARHLAGRIDDPRDLGFTRPGRRKS